MLVNSQVLSSVILSGVFGAKNPVDLAQQSTNQATGTGCFVADSSA